MCTFNAVMKRFLIILIIFSGLFNKVCGQSASASIDSLIKYRVITPKQRAILEKDMLKYKGAASDRVAILGELESIMLQKIFHVDPHKTGIFVSYRNENHDKKSQDSINTALRLLLEKINKAGLLTDRVYTQTRKGIDTGAYMAEVQMIGHLAETTSRLEWLAPDKLLPVAEELHKNGIVGDTSFMRLKDDIRNGKIESSFQLNDYCKLDKTFDLTKYGDDPGAWLEQLHRDMASMLPGLNFTNFSYTTSPDTDSSFGQPGITGIKYKVSLTCNGRVYKYSRVAMTFESKPGKPWIDELFAGGFSSIFNKVLADQQSPLRLHSIMFTPGKDAGDNVKRFALIALTAAQARVFMEEPCRSFMMVSMDYYDNELTSARVDSAIAGWGKIGLFAHLSATEINKAIDNSEADDWFSIEGLLPNFPGVVYSLMSSMRSPHHPYVNLLSHLAGITRGEFKPTKITERKVKGGVKLQYLAKGKIHSYTFKTSYGWMDKKFPAFMNGLGRENNLPGSFYTLWYENAVIYLTKQQHDYAASHNLLNFGRG
jgi:hypothetical protein